MKRDLSIFDEDNLKWREQKKRVPWDDRLELVQKEFPGLLDLDFNSLLRDDDMLARVLKDILKVDQMEPGRAGPRPNVDRERGRQTWREWTGKDYSEAPFPQAFEQLTRGQSFSQIARKTKISRSRIYRLMKASERPSVGDLRTIASAYGKKPAYFAEYRAEYIVAAFAARLAKDGELTIGLYLRLVRA